MNNLPESIMEEVAWSFSESPALQQNEFVSAVYLYNEEIENPLGQGRLSESISRNEILVRYEYAVEINGEWVDKNGEVSVSSSANLTNGEILFQIHRGSYENLHDQDHKFFEGLEFSGEQTSAGVPIYEMYLGS